MEIKYILSVLFAVALVELTPAIYQYLRFANEAELDNFLKNEYETNASFVCTKQVHADWNFATDVSNNTAMEAQLNATLVSAAFNLEYWTTYFKDLDPANYTQEIIQRQVAILKILGVAALSTDKLTELTNILNDMTNIYSTARICPYTNQNCDLNTEGLTLEPGIEAIISTSVDYKELEYAWVAWRNASGAKIKNEYPRYINLSNEAALANGFPDKGALWRNDYETPTLIEDIDAIWAQLEPLYLELHTYIARKLQQRYGAEIDLSDGLIPAHVLGNMWAQSWTNLGDLAKPYPNASAVDVTGALQAQNYTAFKMFETSNEFYLSLGLKPNDISYNESAGAMIEKPTDGREVLCHASAWDFCDGQNYRIKMCTNVNFEDFVTIHHEMGHIQYYLQYADQPITVRTGANPGFHEAVGDTIALSVSTPQHLVKIGLLTDYVDSDEASINALMDMALERVAFLPFGFLIDKWRWDVFAGNATQDQWNARWWFYRQTIQKIKPPVARSDLTDFDPGAKYHVAGDSQYINYFVAHILQFQFYKSLCIAAGQYNPNNVTVPLHKCDFYQSIAAGDKLRAGLSLGKSKHWSDALEAMTGERNLNASALLEYFQPLYEYLLSQNGNATAEMKVRRALSDYDKEFSQLRHDDNVAKWNHFVDLTNHEKSEAQLKLSLQLVQRDEEFRNKYIMPFKELKFSNATLQRQFQHLTGSGFSLISPAKYSQLSKVESDLKSIYSTAKVCPYKKQNCDLITEGLSLEPDLEDIMATSTDPEELLYVWNGWRNATGAKMIKKYKTYVTLSNEGAKRIGYSDTGHMWLADYESDTFIDDIEKLWKQVKPLYNELHTYVATKLKKYYGNKVDVSDGLIPAHILGNMWAQDWSHISHITKPYPNVSGNEITSSLKEQNYTVLKIFETANDFFLSLGLESSAMSYNETAGAMIHKPKDREVVCHASAWNFYDRKDFRIKMCTYVSEEDFITAHHEMGHIQYFILYKDQPIMFQEAANPAFHEAIGDTISLSVSSTSHLKKIGLLNKDEDSEENDINVLMKMALRKVAFLPFGLIIDKWRWDVFSGKTKPDSWNSHWWHYRNSLQKVKAPSERKDNLDFDPGAKFHIPGGSQYITYFLSHILQFQLYKKFCVTAGQYNPDSKSIPLHKCDFYRMKSVGDKLRAGLSLGSKAHWKDVLDILVGERDFNAEALLEYFEPLYVYLRKQNQSESCKLNDLVPIIVGAALGAILLTIVIILVYKKCRKLK